MDLADYMAYIYLFLGTLLVPLMGLEGDQGPCPTPCRCTLEILNCSRITSSPGFHQIPLSSPTARSHPFSYLDFTGNAISLIGKEAWKVYPWAEYVVLKENSLSRLHKSSLEGLLSLTYLDLSCNKIQIIERNVFEAIPFLQIINLSGNKIEQIAEGTFQASHGMLFLFKVDLSHNPLAVIQDSYFYRLPSLKFLDLGATKVTPRTLEDLLQTSLQLRTLVLPQNMSCCLCRTKEDIEVLRETIQLECPESCDINATLCETEEPLNRMQEEVMKILEIRKGGSSLLSILPERAVANNEMLERAKLGNDTLAFVENYSSLAADLNLLQAVKRLMQMKAKEPLDMNWADKSELKRFYLLARLLQAALKEKIVDNEVSDQVLEKPTDEARKRSADTSLREERLVRKATRENSLGRNQRQIDTLFRLGRDGQQVEKTATQSVDKPSVFESRNKAESWRKLGEGLDPQRALLFLRSRQVALRSSWKRSVSDSLTDALMPTGSTVVDNDDNDSTSLSSGENSLVVLRKVLGSQILTKEEPLNPLLQESDNLAGGSTPEISADDSEPSLNELSTDRTSSEYQGTSVSPPLGFLEHQDDSITQGELLETELNKKLTSFIPNTPVRNLISHMIRILKMECTTPTLQMACAKLISGTDLLMKLFSQNANETPSPWKLYFLPQENVTNTTTASSRKLEEPSERTGNQVILAEGYGNKLLLAISVTAIILIIIAAICLIEIWSQRSEAKERTFLGRGKKALSDEELPRTPSLLMDNKPLWLKDMYYVQDETQRNIMVDKLHDEESLEEMDMSGSGSVTASLLEPTVEKALSVPKLEQLITPAPPPPPPPPQQPPSPPPLPSPTPSEAPIEKNVSDTAEGTSEAPTSEAPTSEAPTSADEGEGEDHESLAEKSEPPTEPPSEAPESGEGEEEAEPEPEVEPEAEPVPEPEPEAEVEVEAEEEEEEGE